MAKQTGWKCEKWKRIRVNDIGFWILDDQLPSSFLNKIICCIVGCWNFSIGSFSALLWGCLTYLKFPKKLTKNFPLYDQIEIVSTIPSKIPLLISSYSEETTTTNIDDTIECGINIFLKKKKTRLLHLHGFSFCLFISNMKHVFYIQVIHHSADRRPIHIQHHSMRRIGNQFTWPFRCDPLFLSFSYASRSFIAICKSTGFIL